ncbi:MAG TPA: DsbA family protein [Burkholderiaceae bacterium]|nr:DsbA family protein [Burkholderiaceae bacterium]
MADRLLVYIADPMCSWCYGFGPELDALCAHFPDVPLHLVTGGLRAYNTRVLDRALAQTLGHHWDEVHRQSGQPFSRALLEREDFVYDTEPACRALVAVRENAAPLALPMMFAVQRAFYAQGRDVTRAEVLADVYAAVCADAMDSEFDPTAFSAAFASEATREATRNDFGLVQEWGIRGFPTLLAVQDERPHIVAPGYMKAPALIERTAAIFRA